MNTKSQLGNINNKIMGIILERLLPCVLYALLIYLSTIIIFPMENTPILWSANAIPVAVLLLNRNKNWPIILLFSAVAMVVGLWPGMGAEFNATAQHEINILLILCGTNLIEIFLLAKIIRKVVGPVATRNKNSTIIYTGMWATAVVILLTSILSVILFSFLNSETSFFYSFLRVFSSAFLGQVLLLPAILSWAVLDKRSLRDLSSRSIIELIVIVTSLLLLITLTYASLDSQIPLYFIFPYFTLPLLIWSAFRFGIRITLACSIVTCLFIKYLASFGYIPFGSSEFLPHIQIIGMNVGLIAINVTVLILAVIVAEQKKTKRALTKREEWFEIAINHMTGGLYLLDHERRFKVLSTNLQKKFDLPLEICHLGAHIKQVFKFRAERGDYGPGDPDELVKLRMEELEQQGTTKGQNSPSSGRIYEYSQNHTKEDEIIIIYHDITERLKAERDIQKALMNAQQANKAKTDFLANMSHELRTPLNAIIGFSEIMSKSDIAENSTEKVREYSNDIYMSGHHLLQIINDILDLSKIEAGMTDLEIEHIQLGECIKECVTFLDIRATGAEIAISNEVEHSNTVIQADRRMFKQIIINLLSNSVKFTPRGGSINISHKINGGGETIISVADTGIGIDEDDIESMMEPFRQADSSLSKEFEGTGLGLPLVKSLMELHGGQVAIKSTVGVGTTVLITFPQIIVES